LRIFACKVRRTYSKLHQTPKEVESADLPPKN